MAAALAFLPFLRGALLGHAFYFRDLSRQFFPLRRFALEGLARGELRHWNPYLHEGTPLSLPPLSYPLDLLQLLKPDEAGLSLSLALHVPLAALAFVALARDLGARPLAAAAGAVAYALGGYSLSCVNLYIYVQAAAWAPLVVLAARRAARGVPRALPLAALAAGIAVSTTGAEIVLQAFGFAVLLAFSPRVPRSLWRPLAALALGIGLAFPTVLALRSMAGDSARGAGFPTEVVLGQSIHPLTLMQALVANWHGDLGDVINRFWGSNFFPLGFPYVLSLYLGATLICLAAVGVLAGAPPRGRLLLLSALGVWVSLGRWGGLAPLVDGLPLLHVLRVPSKAFFTVHLAVALLAALGLERLAAGSGRAWRASAATALGLGGLLALLPAAPTLAPAATRWFLNGFLPPGYTWQQRLEVGREIAFDAAAGGLLAVIVGIAGVLVLVGRLAPARGAAAVAVVMAADLLRAAPGLNPMVTPAFYRLSPEMRAVVERARAGGGRVFTGDPESGPAYFRARRLVRHHDVWSFALLMETLTPAFNVSFAVPTALSRDLTMLVPEWRVLHPGELSPTAFGRVVERVRRAAVATVLSVDPLEHESLRLEARLAPARVAPALIHVYSLRDPLPRFALNDPGGRVARGSESTDRLELDVEASRATSLLVRDAFAPGWEATVAGQAVPMRRSQGGHRELDVPAGRSRVVMSYRPPGLRLGLAVAGASALALAWLFRRGVP